MDPEDPNSIEFGNLSIETIRSWIEKKYGIYIELIVDGWGTGETVENVSYRSFIWKLGAPKPSPWDDIGMSNRETILIISLDTILRFEI